jgi:hypothetical protein
MLNSFIIELLDRSQIDLSSVTGFLEDTSATSADIDLVLLSCEGKAVFVFRLVGLSDDVFVVSGGGGVDNDGVGISSVSDADRESRDLLALFNFLVFFISLAVLSEVFDLLFFGSFGFTSSKGLP